jgi:hypothetical protein
MAAQDRGTPHNFELAIDDGNGLKVVGSFEPRTRQRFTARDPDKEKGELFLGWTLTSETTHPHTTTHPSTQQVLQYDSRPTIPFTMPGCDVILKANYKIKPTRISASRWGSGEFQVSSADTVMGLLCN